MADDKKKRGGADRGLIALSDLTSRLCRRSQDHAGQNEVRRQESGRSARTSKLHQAAEAQGLRQGRIAVSQPYEVGYWSKKFKVTPTG